jgi:hypothetical protein
VAIYASLGIECEVYSTSDSPDKKFAYENLFDKIEAHFASAVDPTNSVLGASRPPTDRINRTSLPPIYFQIPSHSLTIVGFERRIDGSRNVVVLDPLYTTNRAMLRLIEVGPRNVKRGKMEFMEIYRRGSRVLRRHSDYEILM